MKSNNASKNGNVVSLAQRLTSIPGITTFIKTLYLLLSDASLKSVIRWNEHGRAVQIVNEQRFTSEVLPVYFNTQKLDTFSRSLYMYEFYKTPNSTKNMIEFMHPKF